MTTYLRRDWGSAFAVGGNVISQALAEVYIHHWDSGIQPATSVESAKARVQAGQYYHALTNGWGDIGYSWMVDNIGNAYEGRGWWRTGAHTYMFNSKGYGICWLGDSNVQLPSPASLACIAALILEGQRIGALVPRPTIVAHRDRVPDTSCCGNPFYAQLPTIRQAISGLPGSLPPVLSLPGTRPVLADEDDESMRLFAQGQTIYMVRAGKKKELMQACREVDLKPKDWGEILQWLNRLHKSGVLATDPNAIPQLDWAEMALIPNEA
jgi:hypothetical protein